MRRIVHRPLCAVLAVIVAACGKDSTQPDPGPASSLVLQHALAQEGLAIALASTVLQSQLLILSSTTGGSAAGGGAGAQTCSTLQGGGSYQSLPIGDNAPTKVGVYYDDGCQQPYIMADVHQQGVASATQLTVNETAAYTAPNGGSMGTLTLTETASANGVNSVSGLGTFTPANGEPPVHLGLTCTIDLSGSAPIPCQGGVVQNFPSLSRSLGSVTELDLDANGILNGTTIGFSGSGANLISGGLNAITLDAPSFTTLALHGGSKVGTTSTTGSAATFSLFPPTPTSWTITDAGNGLRFSISVVDNTVRNLTGTIEDTAAGTTLTTLTLDQSGSGVIIYSDGSHVPVTSWLLGDRSTS